MAITNKAAIQALIDAYTANITLYITSNNNKEITGAQLKQILDESSVILKDLKDSYFNLLDEPRITSTLTFDDGSTNTDWDGDVFPAFQGLVNNQLAERLTNIGVPVAQDIIFVSPDGDNLTAVKGSLNFPFQTIQAGIDAATVNSIVKVLAGDYIESPNIGTKSNFVLDISGCQITGGIVKGSGANVTLLADSARVTGSGTGVLVIQNSGLTVKGGTFTGVGTTPCVVMQISGGGAFFGCVLRSDNAVCVNGNSSYFESCDIKSNLDVGALLSNLSNMKNCKVIGSTLGVRIVDTTVILDNCHIEGNTGVAGSDTIGYECNLIATNKTVIKGLAGNGLTLVRNCEKLLIEDSQIYGTVNSIIYFTNTERLNNSVNVIKNSYLHCGSGEIFVENYAIGDTGKAIMSNSWINKALPALTKITDNFTTLDTGLQILQ